MREECVDIRRKGTAEKQGFILSRKKKRYTIERRKDLIKENRYHENRRFGRGIKHRERCFF